MAYSPNCSILWLQHVLYSSDDKISQPCIKQQHLLQDNSTSYLRVLGSSWGLGLRSISLLHGFKLKLVHVCPNLFHSFWSCLLSCHFATHFALVTCLVILLLILVLPLVLSFSLLILTFSLPGACELLPQPLIWSL